MKWPILLACAVCVMPVTAHAQRQIDETVGAWSLTGTGGDCMIATGSRNGMLAIASPATGGENNGGVMLSSQGLVVSENDVATLNFSGSGPWAGAHPLTGVPDITGYWVAFPDSRTVDSFPESWRVTVVREGKTILDIPVNGFGAARKALWSCVEKTK